VAQEVECLPSNHEALVSNLSPTGKKKKATTHWLETTKRSECLFISSSQQHWGGMHCVHFTDEENESQGRYVTSSKSHKS
jgi:hypothetical protein